MMRTFPIWPPLAAGQTGRFASIQTLRPSINVGLFYKIRSSENGINYFYHQKTGLFAKVAAILLYYS